MAVIGCRDCGGAVSTSAKACPHCGAPALASNRASYLWLIIGLPVGAIALFLIIGALNFSPEKSRARSAIDICWKAVDDPLIAENTKRLAQLSCRKMVIDFENEYGNSPSLRRR